MEMGLSNYGKAALTGAAHDVANAPEGTRNKTLNSNAHSLGQLVGAGVLDESEAERVLSESAHAAGLDQQEAKATIRSGLKAGERNPRTLEAPRARGSARRPSAVPAPVPALSSETDPLPRFKGTRFPSKERPQDGSRFDLTFDEMVALAEKPMVAKVKDELPQVSLATFAGDYRKNGNIEAIHGLALDGDGVGIGLAALRDVFGQVGYVAHTTWQHDSQSPRWRILIPLSRSVSTYEARRLSRWAGRLLPGLDECPPSQAFYVPAQRPGYAFEVNRAPALDVDQVLEALDLEHKPDQAGAWRKERETNAKRIVAACCMDTGLVLEIGLDPSELPDPRLREVFEWIKRRVEAGDKIALLDVENCSGLPSETVNDLIENYFEGSTTDWPIWLERLRQCNQREAVILAMGLGVNALERGTVDPGEAVADVNAAEESQQVEGEAVPMAEAMPLAFEMLERVQAGDVPGFVSTGFYSLDPHSPEAGNLVVIGGKTSACKTQLALQVARNMGVLGMPSLFVSNEMTYRECVWRLLSLESGVPYFLFRTPGSLSPAQRARVQAARSAVEALPIIWSSLSRPDRIVSEAVRLQRRAGIKAVFIDYLQRLDLPRAENRNLQVQAGSKTFADLAKRTGLVVYLLSQLSRPGKDRDNDPPRKSDLRDSGAIEQDAHVIWLLHRPSITSHDLFVGVAKVRNGPCAESIRLTVMDGHILDEPRE